MNERTALDLCTKITSGTDAPISSQNIRSDLWNGRTVAALNETHKNEKCLTIINNFLLSTSETNFFKRREMSRSTMMTNPMKALKRCWQEKDISLI